VGANHLSDIPKEKSFKAKSKKSRITGKGPWRLRWIVFFFLRCVSNKVLIHLWVFALLHVGWVCWPLGAVVEFGVGCHHVFLL
jgi:hypothetical protein